MKQFDICENLHRPTTARAPYVLILQSDLLEPVDVRLVAPLVSANLMTPIRKLTPQVDVAGKRFLVSMLELASVRKQLIGKVAGDLRARRDEFIAALDLLILGF